MRGAFFATRQSSAQSNISTWGGAQKTRLPQARLSGICINLGCPISAIGGIEDHVHILIKLNKNISLSNLVKEIKRSSSIWIKQHSLHEEKLNQFYWQRGYGAFSVSQSNVETVTLYINNQEQHHQKINYQFELLKFLDLNKIDYKEEYLWE